MVSTKSINKKIGPRLSDEAVKAKTGKTWDQWFSILDKAGTVNCPTPVALQENLAG